LELWRCSLLFSLLVFAGSTMEVVSRGGVNRTFSEPVTLACGCYTSGLPLYPLATSPDTRLWPFLVMKARNINEHLVSPMIAIFWTTHNFRHTPTSPSLGYDSATWVTEPHHMGYYDGPLATFSTKTTICWTLGKDLVWQTSELHIYIWICNIWIYVYVYVCVYVYLYDYSAHLNIRNCTHHRPRSGSCPTSFAETTVNSNHKQEMGKRARTTRWQERRIRERTRKGKALEKKRVRNTYAHTQSHWVSDTAPTNKICRRASSEQRPRTRSCHESERLV